VIDRVIAVLYE
jgi:hypothetical protein